jgi:hypothetical protein
MALPLSATPETPDEIARQILAPLLDPVKVGIAGMDFGRFVADDAAAVFASYAIFRWVTFFVFSPFFGAGAIDHILRASAFGILPM